MGILLGSLTIVTCIYAQSGEDSSLEKERSWEEVNSLPDFLESTYLFNVNREYAHKKDTALVFEAEIAPTFLVYNNSDKDKRLTSAMTFTSQIYIRMLYTRSVPLVPPSYVFNWRYFFFLKDQNLEDIQYTFVASYNHHSNGKNSNIVGEDRLDLENGNFSTQYFCFNNYWTIHQKTGEYPAQYNIGIGWETHLPDSMYGYEVAGAMIDRLSENYGRNRIHFHYSMDQQLSSKYHRLDKAKMRFLVDYMYTIEQPKGNYLLEFRDPEVIPRYRLRTEVQYKPNWRSNLGFFLRFQSGQDHYNVYFFKNLTQISAGLVTDQLQFTGKH
jgi:hypothetical protein